MMYITMILNLLFVIALFMGMAFLFYKFNKRKAGSSINLSILGSVSIGAKEKIIIINAENKRILAGVTQQQISYLATLNEDEKVNQVNSFDQYMDINDTDFRRSVSDGV